MQQYQTNTYHHNNAVIVVHRPVLNEQERQKREQRLHRALVAIGKSERAVNANADEIHR